MSCVSETPRPASPSSPRCSQSQRDSARGPLLLVYQGKRGHHPCLFRGDCKVVESWGHEADLFEGRLCSSPSYTFYQASYGKCPPFLVVYHFVFEGLMSSLLTACISENHTLGHPGLYLKD